MLNGEGKTEKFAHLWDRDKLLAQGNEAKGGTEDWMWAVWDKAALIGPTKLGWIFRPEQEPKWSA